jgi:hypothetical protein
VITRSAMGVFRAAWHNGYEFVSGLSRRENNVQDCSL